MTNQTHTPDVPVMYYIRPNISNLKLQLLKMLNTKLSPSFCMASQSHICHTILQKCHTNDSHKGLYQIPGHEHLKVHSAVQIKYVQKKDLINPKRRQNILTPHSWLVLTRRFLHSVYNFSRCEDYEQVTEWCNAINCLSTLINLSSKPFAVCGPLTWTKTRGH